MSQILTKIQEGLSQDKKAESIPNAQGKGPSKKFHFYRHMIDHMMIIKLRHDFWFQMYSWD